MTRSESLADEVDKVAAYLGNEPLTGPEKMVIVDFLNSEFKTIEPTELLEAVKGVIAGRIQTPTDVTRIKKLSTGWWGSVLRGYKSYRSERKARPEAITPDNIVNRLSQFGGVDGKDREYYETLKRMYFEYGGMPPYGYAYKQARDYAATLPDFGVTDKDATLIEDRAKAARMSRPKKQGVPYSEQNVVSQHDRDKQVLRLHFERLTQTR